MGGVPTRLPINCHNFHNVNDSLLPNLKLWACIVQRQRRQRIAEVYEQATANQRFSAAATRESLGWPELCHDGEDVMKTNSTSFQFLIIRSSFCSSLALDGFDFSFTWSPRVSMLHQPWIPDSCVGFSCSSLAVCPSVVSNH